MPTEATPASTGSPGQWVEVRPSAGPARGQYVWPTWAVLTFGALLLLGGLGYLLVRFRQSRARP